MRGGPAAGPAPAAARTAWQGEGVGVGTVRRCHLARHGQNQGGGRVGVGGLKQGSGGCTKARQCGRVYESAGGGRCEAAPPPSCPAPFHPTSFSRLLRAPSTPTRSALRLAVLAADPRCLAASRRSRRARSRHPAPPSQCRVRVPAVPDALLPVSFLPHALQVSAIDCSTEHQPQTWRFAHCRSWSAPISWHRSHGYRRPQQGKRSQRWEWR